MSPIRCPWCGDDPLYTAYHDHEWGRPVHDDRTLFEFLTLEGAQAGLSWITVLRKRENYRKIFYNWDIRKIAEMTDKELEEVLQNPGIIRNRLKVYSVRKNARIALEIQKEFGSLDAYFWNSERFCHREERPVPRSKLLAKGESDPGTNMRTPGFTGLPRRILAGTENSSRNDDTFPIINHPKSLAEIPPETEVSKTISKDLKKRGMSFVGSTIIYAWMQAIGMVDDHIDSCFQKR